MAYGDLGETDGAFGGHFDDSDEEDYDDDDSEESENEEENKWYSVKDELFYIIGVGVAWSFITFRELKFSLQKWSAIDTGKELKIANVI